MLKYFLKINRINDYSGSLIFTDKHLTFGLLLRGWSDEYYPIVYVIDNIIYLVNNIQRDSKILNIVKSTENKKSFINKYYAIFTLLFGITGYYVLHKTSKRSV